jgi:hypothetical protein
MAEAAPEAWTEAAGESGSETTAKSRMEAAETSMKTAAESAAAKSPKPTMKASTAEPASGLGRHKRGSRKCKRYGGRRDQFAKHGTTFSAIGARQPQTRNKVNSFRLQDVLRKRAPWLQYSEAIEGDGPSVWRADREMGLEGIVSKRRNSDRAGQDRREQHA